MIDSSEVGKYLFAVISVRYIIKIKRFYRKVLFAVFVIAILILLNLKYLVG